MKTSVRSVQVLLMCLALLCAMQGAAAAESVVIERDSPLLESPAAGAPAIAQLARGAAGEVLGRKGAWLNLKTSSGTGWVMSFNVRFGGGQAAQGGSGGAAGLGTFLTPQRRTTTATIGIRGLEAEDLRSARIDAQQLKLLDQYSATRQEAEEAAQATGLGAERVPYFVQ